MICVSYHSDVMSTIKGREGGLKKKKKFNGVPKFNREEGSELKIVYHKVSSWFISLLDKAFRLVINGGGAGAGGDLKSLTFWNQIKYTL